MPERALAEPAPAAPAMIDQILAGAERAFLAQGFDLTTMDSVARHAGVARGSVYNHFDSKEALFLAMMERGIAAFVERATREDDENAPPMERLAMVASCFLRVAIQPESLEMYRIVVALGARFPALAHALHAAGLSRIEAHLANIAELDQSGMIDDPQLFAAHLLGLMMGGFFQRHLLGIAASAESDLVAGHVAGLISALAGVPAQELAPPASEP